MPDENNKNNNNNNNNNNRSTSTSTGTGNSASTNNNINNNNNSGSSDGPFSRLFHSMFHNNTNTNTNTNINDTIQQQIHDELNREEERRKHRQEQQRHWAKQRDDFFSSGGLFGRGSGSGSGSSGSIHKELEDMMEEMMNGGGIFGNTNGTNQNGGFSRSYIHQMRQEYSPNGVQISVSVPPSVKSANDLEVQVVQMEPSCVVQWNATTTTTTTTTTPAATRGHLHQQQSQQQQQQRVRLGSSVDCEQLSANLSRGMLKLSAPNKDNYSFNDASKNSMDTEPARSIPITELEHDNN